MSLSVILVHMNAQHMVAVALLLIPASVRMSSRILHPNFTKHAIGTVICSEVIQGPTCSPSLGNFNYVRAFV